MKLTAKQKVELRKWSTAMSGHNNDGNWFCPHCREWVEGRHVTFTELHEFCGFPVDKEIENDERQSICDAIPALLEEIEELRKALQDVLDLTSKKQDFWNQDDEMDRARAYALLEDKDKEESKS